jgi:pimeloyl-ACP methyl ester carboxylesterase
MEFRTVASGELRFVISQLGGGDDVVLLHGFPDTPYSFEPLQRALAGAGWRVTVPWLRGYHPDTITPGRPYDPETLGHDVLALLDAIGVPRAVLVGHDWGALLTYVAVALAPERVPGLVTIAIPFPSLLRRTPAALWAGRHFLALKMPWAAGSFRRGDFAYLERLYSRWAPNWSGPAREQSIAETKRALSSEETLGGALDYYRALPLSGTRLLDEPPEVPGLIVGGTVDLVPAELFTASAALLPAPSRALIVEGAGHWPHREDPTVNSQIAAFVGEL